MFCIPDYYFDGIGEKPCAEHHESNSKWNDVKILTDRCTIFVSACLEVNVLSSKIGFEIILTFEGKQVMKQEITGE